MGTDPYPFGVTVAFDRVWVTSHDGNAVDVVDPVTDQVTRTIGLEVQPGSVVSGGGSIWVQSRTDDSLYRIDPDTYEATTIALPGIADSACTIAFAHGLVWAATANESGNGTIFEVDPATGDVATRVHLKGFPCGWASLGNAEWTIVDDGLVRLIPGREQAEIVPVDGVRGEAWLTGAVDGLLYVNGSDGMLGSEVFRVDPSGAVTGKLVTHSDLLQSLVANEEGIWFSSNGTDDILVMDPGTMKFGMEGTLATGEVVPDPTMELTDLWLPDADNTAVVHVDPEAFLRPVG